VKLLGISIACNKGVLTVDADAGPVRFRDGELPAAKSIS